MAAPETQLTQLTTTLGLEKRFVKIPLGGALSAVYEGHTDTVAQRHEKFSLVFKF